MNIGTVVLLVLAAACEFIASVAPNLWSAVVKNWMTLGFFFFILSMIVTVTISVAPK